MIICGMNVCHDKKRILLSAVLEKQAQHKSRSDAEPLLCGQRLFCVRSDNGMKSR